MTEPVRDIAISTQQALESHIEECSRRYEAVETSLEKIERSIEAQRIESAASRLVLHQRLDKVLWGLLTAMGAAIMALGGGIAIAWKAVLHAL